METLKSHGGVFYIDQETIELSERYAVNSYRGPSSTIGEAITEINVGRLLFLARICRQIVGTDLESYLKEYPGEEWFDKPECVYEERQLEFYLDYAGKRTGEQMGRIVKLPDRKIFYPTEALVKMMMRGKRFIPPEEYLARHARN